MIISGINVMTLHIYFGEGSFSSKENFPIPTRTTVFRKEHMLLSLDYINNHTISSLEDEK